MNIINSIIRFFAEGGFWMYPILAVGAIGIAITVERIKPNFWSSGCVAKDGSRSRSRLSAWPADFPARPTWTRIGG